MPPLDVLLLFNAPVLPSNHPDSASEAGVLETVDAVSRALTSGGQRVKSLGIDAAAGPVANQLREVGPADVVFNLCEGLRGVGEGEEQVAGLIERMGYPMTGSSAECLSLVRDKARAKRLLAEAGLTTPQFECVEVDGACRAERLEALLALGPVIVKPAHEDASLGIGPHNVVDHVADLWLRIDELRNRYGRVLVEQFIDGREFNAAIIAIGQPRLLPLAEIEFDDALAPAARIVTYDAKWALASAECRQTVSRCPASVHASLADAIGRAAMAVFRSTGCRDYARIDFRASVKDELYVLEVNANPDLSPTAGLASALSTAGIDYGEFVNQLVAHAWQSRRRAAAC